MKQRLLFLFAFFSLVSCEEAVPKIKVIDFDKHKLRAIHGGITVKRAEAHSKKMRALVLKSTEGFAIPNVLLKNKLETNLDLYSLTHERKSILLFSSTSCGACSIAYFENFPFIIDSLKRQKIKYNIIPIVVSNERDSEQPDRFKKHLSRFQKFYPEVYVLEDSLSKKFNIYGFPLQLFIDEKGVVKDYQLGASFDGYQKKMKKVFSFFSTASDVNN